MGVNRAITDRFKAAISQRFKMRDLGPLQSFLGMEITRDRAARTITVTMQGHIREMAMRFGVEQAKGTDTPLPPKMLLSPDEDGTKLGPRTPYRAIVGSLLYIATWVRPDIAFAVTQLARFQQAPTELHWGSAKHVLRYLKATCGLGIVYQALVREGSAAARLAPGPNGLGSQQLYGFVDASWGEDPSTRRSQSAYVFMIGNAAVSWQSKLQHTVALSSCEAEYLSLSAAVKALHLRYLLSDILSHSVLNQPILLFEPRTTRAATSSSPRTSRRRLPAPSTLISDTYTTM